MNCGVLRRILPWSARFVVPRVKIFWWSLSFLTRETYFLSQQVVACATNKHSLCVYIVSVNISTKDTSTNVILFDFVTLLCVVNTANYETPHLGRFIVYQITDWVIFPDFHWLHSTVNHWQQFEMKWLMLFYSRSSYKERCKYQALTKLMCVFLYSWY